MSRASRRPRRRLRATVRPVELLLIILALTVVGLWLALLRAQQRRRTAARRLARAVGHPSASTRQSTAIQLAQLLAELGMIATRIRTTITAIGLDGDYVLHVLPDSIAIGYDTNRGREFVAIVDNPREAQAAVARHAELPMPA